ncbi:MAG: bacterial transcriptional activator domain-containing protein [Acidimicrobiales bacterium]
MSSPIPSTSESDLRGAPHSSVMNSTSALALSGLLKVQRRWSLAYVAGLEAAADDLTTSAGEALTHLDGAHLGDGGPHGTGPTDTPMRRRPGEGAAAPVLATTGRNRLPIHLEDSEWTRLALGVAADVLALIGAPANAELLQLGPDSVTVHVPTLEPPPWPFTPGRVAKSWTLARDPRIIASLPITSAITGAARNAALVTLSELHGRRGLVDLVALGSTSLKGSLPAVGVKIADVAVELGTRRWSDLETLVLVAFDGAMPRLEGTRHVPNVASALEEITVRSANRPGSPSICVVVPPWACDPGDPLLGELIRFCERTRGVGVLCCAGEALCVWELAGEPADQPTLTFGDGRRIPGLDLSDLSGSAAGLERSPQAGGNPGPGPGPGSAHGRGPGNPVRAVARRIDDTRSGAAAQVVPIEISVLGNVQVNGGAESFRCRRRLTELVAFLAMHPEGATTDAFATALWPERRVPLQTLANRLSETRRALGLASDGRPRLRKQGRRHLIVECETDWDRFKELASNEDAPDSWRRALALVRGRPFDGLDRGEWAQLEGHMAAVEASVVGVACRLGELALGRGEGGLAHWAALQGLLVSPWDERLYRLMMRAADGLGNRGGVDAALRSLARALELEGDPLLSIHPETSALYRSLTSTSPA